MLKAVVSVCPSVTLLIHAYIRAVQGIEINSHHTVERCF